MAEMDRDDLLALVHRQLLHRGFANRFDRMDDGTTPIVAALPSDSVEWLLDRVVATGSRANVVSPLFDGLIVFAMHALSELDKKAVADPSSLRLDCTVGLLVQRLVQDGGNAVYRFASASGPGSDRDGEVARPRLLAV